MLLFSADTLADPSAYQARDWGRKKHCVGPDAGIGCSGSHGGRLPLGGASALTQRFSVCIKTGGG